MKSKEDEAPAALETGLHFFWLEANAHYSLWGLECPPPKLYKRLVKMDPAFHNSIDDFQINLL